MKPLHKSKFLFFIVILATLSISFTQSDFYRKIANSQRLINQVYNQIFSTYVDQLDPEVFTKSSINSITENLDPYTTLLVEDQQDVEVSCSSHHSIMREVSDSNQHH